MVFQNRQEAGRQLAKKLAHYKGKPAVVYGLPRGGVAVAAEVARYLNAPLDVLVARKIGHPYNREYAIGAVTETSGPVWDEGELAFTSEQWREQQVALAKQEAKRRRISYKGDQSEVDATGRTAIVVDDGIATGLTMTAALRQLRHRGQQQVVVAVPVAPRDIPKRILRYSDGQIYVLYSPPGGFGAIGLYYRHFEQVTDEEVRQLLWAYRPQLAEEPLDLAALNAVLGSVTRYPVTNGELLDRAQRQHAPRNVVAFFESIPKDVEYEDKVQVMERAGEVELLMEEERHEPPERLLEEDR